MKQCSKCKEVKEDDQFYKNKRFRNGLNSYCKSCSYDYNSKLRRKDLNPEYLASDKQKLRNKLYKATHYYKISKEEALRLYTSPCEICGCSNKIMCIDHNHDTGKVRGSLCIDCNRGLGGFLDSPDLLKKALRYLDNIK